MASFDISAKMSKFISEMELMEVNIKTWPMNLKSYNFRVIRQLSPLIHLIQDLQSLIMSKKALKISRNTKAIRQTSHMTIKLRGITVRKGWLVFCNTLFSVSVWATSSCREGKREREREREWLRGAQAWGELKW